METSKLKNMVVLKNLPSNIVDEAIVVLKTNKKIKKLQKIEQNKNLISNENDKKDKEYILKEAEILVNNYNCYYKCYYICQYTYFPLSF